MKQFLSILSICSFISAGISPGFGQIRGRVKSSPDQEQVISPVTQPTPQSGVTVQNFPANGQINGPASGRTTVQPLPSAPELISRPGQIGTEPVLPGVDNSGADYLGKGRLPRTQIDNSSTKFASLNAYPVKGGNIVRWQMEVERNNVGFAVYRMDAAGPKQISQIIQGSAFRYSDQPAYGESYAFLDKSGKANSIYFVVSYEMSGQTIRSNYASVVPQSPDTETATTGISSQAASDLPKNADAVASSLDLPADLSLETVANLQSPDPVKHLEVITSPGVVRIGARGPGVVRVTKAQLQNAGFDVNSDPNYWQLFYLGNERPLIIGPNADYIEFLSGAYDSQDTDISVYYLRVGNSPGKRIRYVFPRNMGGVVKSSNYFQTFVLKDRSNYVNKYLNGDAENFFGRLITSNTTSGNISFNLSGIYQNGGNCTLRLSYLGFSLTPHQVNININGNDLQPATGNFMSQFQAEYSIPIAYLREGLNTIAMKTNATNDFAFLDTVEIAFPRTFVAINNKLDFYTVNYQGAVLSGFTSPNIRVFDVTLDGNEALVGNLQIQQTGSTWGPVIPSARGRKYFAVESNTFLSPVWVNANDTSLLTSTSNAAQLLIITTAPLMSSAQQWAAYRAGQGFTTKIVEMQEIFDEFSFGITNSDSLKAFLNYAYHNWQNPPQYILLIGDSIYDPKNYENRSYTQLKPWEMLPAKFVNTVYMETASDEALADFNNDGLAEIPIGRIPARDNQSVLTALNKTSLWESSIGPSSFSRGALFVYDTPDGYDFQAMSSRIASNISSSMSVTEIQRGTPSLTESKNEVISGFNNGKYILNYSGHGITTAWKDLNFFSIFDVPSLTNANNPSTVTALTCLNGYFVSTSTDTLSEKLVTASNGGAAAVWASTGLTTPDVQEIMASRFYNQLAAGNIIRLGDLVNDAKSQIFAGSDVRFSWALIGDPMLKMH